MSLCQNGCAVGVTFNCAHDSPPEQHSPEYSATSACEKSQLTHVHRLWQSNARNPLDPSHSVPVALASWMDTWCWRFLRCRNAT